jgi:tetraacyldisaccharide 4'-kinase
LDWAVSTALLPFSWLYSLGWRSYAAVYQLGFKKRRQFNTPILGIGNLEVGGSGKTPVTIAVAKLLAGRPFAISASAYGSVSSRGATFVPVGAPMSPDIHGDEPCLIRQKLPETPLILGRDRVRAAEIAEAMKIALILDDGFQHLPLARNADIVLWDDGRRNKRTLPAGPLREPVSGLRRASALLKQEGGGAFAYRRVFPQFTHLASGKKVGWEALRDHPVSALCAIARPDSFFDTLTSGGLKVTHSLALPDHDPLSQVTLDPSATWVVTEKDAVKLLQRDGLPAETYALEMNVQFCDEEALLSWLNAKLFP